MSKLFGRLVLNRLSFCLES